jgi:hypothetical protein
MTKALIGGLFLLGMTVAAPNQARADWFTDMFNSIGSFLGNGTGNGTGNGSGGSSGSGNGNNNGNVCVNDGVTVTCF